MAGHVLVAPWRADPGIADPDAAGMRRLGPIAWRPGRFLAARGPPASRECSMALHRRCHGDHLDAKRRRRLHIHDLGRRLLHNDHPPLRRGLLTMTTFFSRQPGNAKPLRMAKQPTTFNTPLIVMSFRFGPPRQWAFGHAPPTARRLRRRELTARRPWAWKTPSGCPRAGSWHRSFCPIIDTGILGSASRRAECTRPAACLGTGASAAHPLGHLGQDREVGHRLGAGAAGQDPARCSPARPRRRRPGARAGPARQVPVVLERRRAGRRGRCR